jgi:hypothetical protein
VETSVRDFTSDARTREASPNLIDTPLPPPEVFIDLTRTEQLRLLRPQLRLLINEQYAPAQKRIDLFFNVHRTKPKLLQTSVLYGDISDEEVINVLLPELQRWLLRSCQPDQPGVRRRLH